MSSDSPPTVDVNATYDISSPVDDLIVVKHVEGNLYEDLQLEVEYQDQNDSTETVNVEITNQGGSQSIDLSSRNPSLAELIRNGEIIERKDFSTNEQPTDQGPELGNIRDKNVKIDEELELDADDYIKNESEVDQIDWNMGDSTNYEEREIQHNYDSIGEYKLTLTATNNTNDTSTTIGANVNVKFDVIREIQIEGNKTVGEELVFNGTETTSDRAQSIEWIIDGEFSSDDNTEYVFEESGLHTVEMLVTSTNGNIETKTWTIDISE
jgi:PKD domain.